MIKIIGLFAGVFGLTVGATMLVDKLVKRRQKRKLSPEVIKALIELGELCAK